MPTSQAAALSVSLLLTSSLVAQIPPGHAVIASQHANTPQTRLYDLDLATGAVLPISRFPSDGLRPLGVRIDPVDDGLLLALADPGGTRLIRLTLAGLQVRRETPLATVPGVLTDLAVDQTDGFFFLGRSDILFTTGGPGGGLWRLPRRGRTAVQVWRGPRSTALVIDGAGKGYVVQDGLAGPPAVDPALFAFDFRANAPTGTPVFMAGHRPLDITGVGTIDAGRLQPLYLIHADNTLSTPQFFTAGALTTLATTPRLPAGATRKLRVQDNRLLVLGGRAHPRLMTIDPLQLARLKPWQMLSGNLPGDPVDFDATSLAGARVRLFGERCAGTTLRMQVVGRPLLGASRVEVRLSGSTNAAPAALVVGVSERSLGSVPLPTVLPGGCPWTVSAEALFLVPLVRGIARIPFAVPNNPQLEGANLYAEWAQLAGGRLVTSQAAAFHIHRR